MTGSDLEEFVGAAGYRALGTVSWSVDPDDELRIPVSVPAWLVLSDVSAQAVRLYCLYKLGVPNFSRTPAHFPQYPEEIAAALQLDLEQFEAVHQELIAVGAVEEDHRVDEAGKVRTVLLVNELSPSQRAEEDRRERWRQERLAELRAAEETSGQTRTVAKGFVYVIAQVGTSRVKIGYTRDVASRLKTLQTSNPYKLGSALPDAWGHASGGGPSQTIRETPNSG